MLAGALLLWSGCRDGAPSAAPVQHAETAAGASATVPIGADAATGERVKARNDKGDTVPLHAEQGDSSVSARVPVGTELAVLEKSADGRWFRVRAPDGTVGWLTRRYVASDATDAAAPNASLLPKGSIWGSRAACEAALAAGQRLARPAGMARLGTWNVRWFPDGKPGKNASESPTDLAWLACAIAWLDVDALAVQEFKRNERARAAIERVLEDLNRHTRGAWVARFDDCPNEDAQHVGVLYDGRRVKAEPPLTLAVLNPRGEACKDNLRPGLGVYLKFPGGLDLHFVSVHTKSGAERRSLELRDKTLRALDRAQVELGKAHADGDVVVAGDFNTMGCKECSPVIGPDDELLRFDAVIGKLASPLRRLGASRPCSEYHARRGTLLDHFLASRALSELPPDATSAVSGVCGEAACRVLPSEEKPAAEERLSDHCPVVLDIPDRDQD